MTTSRPGMHVLLGAAPPASMLDALRAKFTVTGPVAPPFAVHAPQIAPGDRADVQAIVTMGTVATTREAMALFPALGLICCIGSGYEGVDLEAARARGIRVAHSPGANAGSVADVAVGLMIASVRGFHAAEQRLRRGEWQGNAAQRLSPRRGLAGRRLGIFGMGAIGREIAGRARAFGMQVGYHNRHRREGEDAAFFATLPAMADWCDVLMVAVRASAATHHAVDAAILAALGPDGHVINIARGSVIDEAALIEALARGTIGGAGLDVYEHEPEVPAALLALPNVVALPHIGGTSQDAQAAMQAMVIANLDAFFAGYPLPTPVAG